MSKVNRITFLPVCLTYFFEYVTSRQGKRTASIFLVFFSAQGIKVHCIKYIFFFLQQQSVLQQEGSVFLDGDQSEPDSEPCRPNQRKNTKNFTHKPCQPQTVPQWTASLCIILHFSHTFS